MESISPNHFSLLRSFTDDTLTASTHSWLKSHRFCLYLKPNSHWIFFPSYAALHNSRFWTLVLHERDKHGAVWDWPGPVPVCGWVDVSTVTFTHGQSPADVGEPQNTQIKSNFSTEWIHVFLRIIYIGWSSKTRLLSFDWLPTKQLPPPFSQTGSHSLTHSWEAGETSSRQTERRPPSEVDFIQRRSRQRALPATTVNKFGQFVTRGTRNGQQWRRTSKKPASGVKWVCGQSVVWVSSQSVLRYITNHS